MYGELLKNSHVTKYISSFNSFYFANGLASSFINILFFSTGNLIIVLEFQISYQISQLFMFILSGTISNSLKTRYIYASGNIVRAISLILVISVGGIFLNQVFFGIIYGMSGGLFWAGNAIVSLEVSRGTDRHSFLSLNSTVSYIVSFVSPIVGGVVLEATPMKGVLRYIIVFFVTASILIFSAIQANSLKAGEKTDQKVKIIDSIYADRHINRSFKSYFLFSSVYIFAITVILPIYVFEITENYTIVGFLAAFMAGMSAIGNVFSPKLLKKGKNRIAYLYASIIIVSSLVFLDMKLHPIVFTFLTGGIAMIFVAPINNRSMSNFMNSVDILSTSFPYWINREYYLLTGRFIMLISTLIITSLFGISAYIHILTVMSFTVIFMLPAVKNT
jgi:MFS family permease